VVLEQGERAVSTCYQALNAHPAGYSVSPRQYSRDAGLPVGTWIVGVPSGPLNGLLAIDGFPGAANPRVRRSVKVTPYIRFAKQ
jgi:hypothetical protein